jgi:SAM-dependent methyltransferase
VNSATIGPVEDTTPFPADDYYERGLERDRLAAPLGQVEFIRTQQILLRNLPAAPATVADIGGGPGRYALWLSGLGYHVRHRDVVPLHVDQLLRDAADCPGVEAAVGDARQLDLADESADAVLLLGPLYHLDRRDDRVQALAEARRVVRSGGPVFVAAISRWAPRLHGLLVERVAQHYPVAGEMIQGVERTGQMPPLHPGSFCGYCHRPAQLRDEIQAAGLDVVDLVSVEGLAFALADLEERLGNPADRRLVLGTAEAIERIPELLGLGPHLLATARRPQ